MKRFVLAVTAIVLLLAACSGDDAGGERSGESPRGERGGGSREGGRGGGGRGGWDGGDGFGGGGDGDRGVPVQVTAVTRRPISSFLETHGTLEAENEVDLVARVSGPIVDLRAEEGMTVRKGQVLARIDDREIRAQLDVVQVRLDETRLAYERAKQLHGSRLVSQEALDQALASYQSAQGDAERIRVQLQYTEISAPFAGLIVERYVKFAEHLAAGARLFRLSDFDPLLCPIQVPERELPRLAVGQEAWLEVEAFGDERFSARVLRISPVVDAATGTVKVTLEVDGRGKLRPGMFAGVYLEMERREQALVIPKAALALDSLGDTVFVAEDGVAARRAVELGFQNQDLLEVRSGVEEGESVIVVGQDGLSDGTPIEILEGGRAPASPPSAPQGPEGEPGAGPGRRGGPPGGSRDLDSSDPDQVERVKQRMRERGLSEQEIEERLKRMQERR